MSASTGEPVVFWGCGGQALVLTDILAAMDLRLAGVVSDAGEAAFAGLAVSRWAEFADSPLGQQRPPPFFVVAIGGERGGLRLECFALMKRHGLRPLTLVHPTALRLSGSVVGEACQILARAVVGVDARLGDAVIVNTGAIVDHETQVGSGSHIAPGAVLLGRARLGERVFVGANATVLPNVSICSDVVVGAGAVVRHDIERAGTYVGAPARRIQS